jgi:hypothetical protein
VTPPRGTRETGARACAATYSSALPACVAEVQQQFDLGAANRTFARMLALSGSRNAKSLQANFEGDWFAGSSRLVEQEGHSPASASAVILGSDPALKPSLLLQHPTTDVPDSPGSAAAGSQSGASNAGEPACGSTATDRGHGAGPRGRAADEPAPTVAFDRPLTRLLSAKRRRDSDTRRFMHYEGPLEVLAVAEAPIPTLTAVPLWWYPIMDPRITGNWRGVPDAVLQMYCARVSADGRLLVGREDE